MRARQDGAVDALCLTHLTACQTVQDSTSYCFCSASDTVAAVTLRGHRRYPRMWARQDGVVDALCLAHFTACQTVRYSTSYCCCSASDTAAAVTLRVLRRSPRMRARQDGAVDALCLTHLTACQTVQDSTSYCCCSASHTAAAVTLRVLRRSPRMRARQDGAVDALCLTHLTACQTVQDSTSYCCCSASHTVSAVTLRGHRRNPRMRARQDGAVDALCLTHLTACQTVQDSTSYCCCSASDTVAAVTLRGHRRYPRMRARQDGAVDALCLTHLTACETVQDSTSYCCCSASDTAAAVTLRVLRRSPRMRARQDGVVDALCLAHFTACQTVRYSTSYCCYSA
ncbi:hypothetical protein FA13DRAFT_1787318 [Coprinellus micaceus]|uniref:Uncharacterized protein n=1 Tax=Coprinellus micaceus TaxID=71717 RepID=A0A4Y7TSA2_COPMI|nr:hypothetical protein FA13DRAFT_1787318 [Coprinellus micaceus]